MAGERQEFGTCGGSRPDLSCRSGGADGLGGSGPATKVKTAVLDAGIATADALIDSVDAVEAALNTPGEAVLTTYDALEPYAIGAANELYKLAKDGMGSMNVHHAPQAHVAEQSYAGYSRKTGPAIVLPASEHVKIPRVRGPAETPVRRMLATEVLNLRRHTNAPATQIRKWLTLAKDYFRAWK
jgi:hypothetical protein